jgi:predicted methyltransferase
MLIHLDHLNHLFTFSPSSPLHLFTSITSSPRGSLMAQTISATLLAAALIGICAAASAADVVVSPEIQAIVDSPDRSQADRETDKRRHPAELLAFAGVKPGMAVFEVGTGRGYTAELLARAVAPGGRVVAQNDPLIVEKFLKNQTDPRFAQPVMKNVQVVVRPFDDPIPPDAGPFDLITVIFEYHDTVWMGRDRAAMNKAFFDALRPGGYLVIADHAGNPGTGATQTDTLHRIEESVVRDELEAAGFRLVAEAQFLRNPDDPRDAPFFKATVPVDQFVLKYQRPVGYR